MPAKIPISYVELPSTDIAATKDFYGSLFGWTFQDFGPTYAAFENAGLQGGFQAGSLGRTAAPLVCLETDNLEALFEKIKASGVTITAPIFAYPGGRRFHFNDPSGNELAAIQND